jgi:hypothetical protein
VPDTRQFDVQWFRWTDDGSALGRQRVGALQLDLKAGNRGVSVHEGYGEDFEVREWARSVTVYVSPTGRSVRVWVDGREVVAGADSST